MVKVHDVEFETTTVLSDSDFRACYGRFMTDEEIDALHAGDLVCIDTGDSVLDVEVVK